MHIGPFEAISWECRHGPQEPVKPFLETLFSFEFEPIRNDEWKHPGLLEGGTWSWSNRTIRLCLIRRGTDCTRAVNVAHVEGD